MKILTPPAPLPHHTPMATPDDGRRVKPSYLVLGTALGCLAMIYGAWFVVGEMAAAIVGLLSFPVIILAGCVAAVARSAWLHRYQVFTHMKTEDAKPHPVRPVDDDRVWLSPDGSWHRVFKNMKSNAQD